MKASIASRVYLLVLGLAVSVGPSLASAQCAPAKLFALSAHPGAISGVVVDSAAGRLDGAEVAITELSRRTRSGADGRFEIDGVKSGKYHVSIRKLGYTLLLEELQVPDSGSTTVFCMSPKLIRLIPVITSAKRLGLTGVVGDSTYHPLPGADVRAFGAGERAVTDSAGGFYLPLKPGPHSLLFSKEGYGRQMVTVTIPKDSGREVAIWLGPIQRNPNRMFAAYDDMRRRLLSANANRSALRSAEDLAKISVDLRFAVQEAIRSQLPPAGKWDCKVIVDGGPWELPIDLVKKEDVATLEVYMNKAPRRAPTSISTAGTSQGKTLSTNPRSVGSCGVYDIYVWMK